MRLRHTTFSAYQGCASKNATGTHFKIGQKWPKYNHSCRFFNNSKFLKYFIVNYYGFGQTNVITAKTQDNAEIVCWNSVGQLDFSKIFSHKLLIIMIKITVIRTKLNRCLFRLNTRAVYSLINRQIIQFSDFFNETETRLLIND